MEAISDKTGEITFPQMRKYREVKNGYTRFINGDVLWAKITPCMQNGKCAVARNLVNGFGFGSTEFHIIRPKDHNNILSEYIWVFLRMERLRKAAQRYFIGSAGQQRVPSLFLTDIYIPFPPIEIQRVIVQQMLGRVAEITKERERADRLGVVTKQEVEEMILGTRPVP
jgi:type I restriction enzyme S subunit